MNHNSATILPQNESEIARMFNKISARYDLLNHLLSLNIDKMWRRHLVDSLPKKADLYLLDVATGTCDVLLEAAKRRPDIYRMVGADISTGMLEIGQKKIDAAGLAAKVELVVRSAENLQFPDQSFDAISISFGLRNVIDKAKALGEFHRVLKSSGVVAILEFFTPTNSIFAKVFLFYFQYVLPRIGALLSDGEAYRYLPKSVGGFYSPDELKQVMTGLGFKAVTVKPFLFGACRLVTAQK